MEYERILALINGYKISNAFFIAAELNLFDYIDGKTKTTNIAKKLLVDEKALEILFNLFKVIQVLEKNSQGIYSLKHEMEPLLKSKMPNSLIPLIKLESYLSESHTSKEILKEAVNSGKGRDLFNINKKENKVSLYGEAMDNGGQFASICVARELVGVNARKILDVGGGAGTYAIQVCKMNKNTEVTIIDREEMQETCMKNIAAVALSERIRFVEGDLKQYEFKDNYDGIIVSNILHLFDDKSNQILIKKLVGALKDDGIIIFHDFFLKKEDTKSFIPTLYTLDWLMHGTFFYADKEKMTSWVESYGLKIIKTREYKELPTSIIVAKKFKD